MKRYLSVALCTLALALNVARPAAADQTPNPTATPALVVSAPALNVFTHHAGNAPADEYFGHVHMSILGVRNVIHDVDARADGALDDVARNLCHKLTFVEDALRDWHVKYPQDTWIPKLGYSLLGAYQKIGASLASDESNDANVRAVDLAGWLEGAFPNSEFALK